MGTLRDSSQKKFDPRAVTRPDPALLRYYFVQSLFALVFFPIPFIPLYLKYITLRYHVQEDGISVRWGVFFQREVHLTYRRIQDIHVTCGLIQRWMGLATIGIQTASGSATPEMNIEGILEAEAFRDFLYDNMRGARGEVAAATKEPDMALALLHEIRDLLRHVVKPKP